MPQIARKALPLAVTVLVTLGAGSARAGVIYVDANGTSCAPADGSSWCHAFADLQTALQSATPGTEIRVAGGVYKPTSAPTDRLATFRLPDRVVVLGGFAGFGAPNPDLRDPSTFVSTLSGDLLGDDGAGFANNGDNSYHVVMYDNPSATGVALDGFTVSGGNADGTGPGGSFSNQGAGIHIRAGSKKCIPGGPMIRNCVIEDNWSEAHGALNDHATSTVIDNCAFRNNFSGISGAALQVQSGSTTVTNCTFDNNTSDGTGGAVWTGHSEDPTCAAAGSQPRFTNCTFTDNVGFDGGAMYNDGSSPTIDACTFQGNRAELSIDGDAGAMFNTNFSTVAIVDCVFDSNQAGRKGGSVYIDAGTTITIDGSTFRNNNAYWGDLWALDGTMTVRNCVFDGNKGSYGSHLIISNCSFTDCVFTRNTARVNNGGAASVVNGDYSFTNCEFYGNSAVGQGGALEIEGKSAQLTNCIFSGNGASAGFNGSGVAAGGAVHVENGSNPSTVKIDNCTFVNNVAASGPGLGVEVFDTRFGPGIADVRVHNSIMWNGPDAIWEDGHPGISIDVINSDIEGGYTGTGNIALDPLFVSPLGLDGQSGTEDDDLRVQAASPCVDAGSAALLPPDAGDLDGDGNVTEPVPFDLDGNPRVAGATVDMGAFEQNDCNNNGVPDGIDISSGNSTDCDGNGVPDECDPDCNNNGIADGCEPDRDGDGTIDVCDSCPDDPAKVVPGMCGCGVSESDSDGDTILDCFDVCHGFDDRIDTDGDGTPDGCDTCNGSDTTIDCNHNGYSDPCEILDGVTPDQNQNGLPDVCEIMPAVVVEGCRAIGATPPPGTDTLALHLTSQQLPCLDRWVTPSGGLSDTPTFATPAEWGTLVVAQPDIIPDTLYILTAEFSDGTVSAEAWVTSAPWGDVMGADPGTPPDGDTNFRDISGLVSCFLGDADAPPLYRCDISPANPDGQANFQDIAAGVEGFLQVPYSLGTPCP